MVGCELEVIFFFFGVFVWSDMVCGFVSYCIYLFWGL